MHSRAITSIVGLLAAACSAQFTGREQIANLVLAEQSAISSSVSCGSYYDDIVPSAIAVRIFGNYTNNTCYNLDEIFSQDSYPDDTTVLTDSDGAVSSCDPLNLTCGNPYQVSGLNFYESEANYSQAQVDIYFDGSRSLLNQFTIKVFPGGDCQDDTATPYVSWGGCSADMLESYCHELPYGVRSFRLERATESDTECMIAAERGAGDRVAKAGMVAAAGGVMVAGLLAMV